jgi:hypothetical protein
MGLVICQQGPPVLGADGEKDNDRAIAGSITG